MLTLCKHKGSTTQLLLQLRLLLERLHELLLCLHSQPVIIEITPSGLHDTSQSLLLLPLCTLVLQLV